MGYFDTEQNVEEYLSMAEGHDGKRVIDELAKHALAGARVLELGMGGGKDLVLLREAGFEPTGSDSSEVFLARYREQGGTCPTLLLDAVTLATDQKFDAIYSNKVLQHLPRADVAASLERQAQLVEPGGVLVHSLWLGEGEEKFDDLLFTYFTRETLEAISGRPWTRGWSTS